MWNSKIDNFIHFEVNTKTCFKVGVKTTNDATLDSSINVGQKKVSRLAILNSTKSIIEVPKRLKGKPVVIL